MKSSKLTWFEVASLRLRLPNWIGHLIVGFFPFAALYLIGSTGAGIVEHRSLASAFFATITTFIFIAIFILPATGVTFFFTRYINGKVTVLKVYSNGMARGEGGPQLSSQYRFLGVLGTWLLLLVLFTPIFYSFSGQSFAYWLLTLPAWYYFMLGLATFIWTFGYAMFAIDRMGRQPLELRSFTEDRTLGLRPFGRESLRLTGIYLLFVSVVIGIVLFSSPIPFDVAATVLLGLSLLGLGFFLLPLMNLHRKLVEAKRERLSWITPRYSELVRQMELRSDMSRDEKLLLSSELSAVDKVQRDIAQIHTWPFDIGLLFRLVTIILLPVILSLVGKLILVILHL